MTMRSVSPEGIATMFHELPAPVRGPRRRDLDAARGLAILLVVVGHVVARDLPPGNGWYGELKRLIYLFHMPLFMTLSGITFAMSLPRFARWRDVAAFSARRIQRLMLPYLAFGVAIIVGKLVMARWVHVDNLPTGSWRDFALLLLVPAQSAAGFLWFVYVLSFYIAAVPALFHAAGRYPVVLLAAGVALAAWVDAPPVLMLDRVVEYLPFFALGMVLWQHAERWQRMGLAATAACIACFAALLAASFALDVPKWLAGAASVPAVLALAQHLPAGVERALGTVGVASLAIYLMNTIMIGLAKAALLLVMPWDGANFLLFFPVLLAAGSLLPMAIRRHVQRRWPAIGRYL